MMSLVRRLTPKLLLLTLALILVSRVPAVAQDKAAPAKPAKTPAMAAAHTQGAGLLPLPKFTPCTSGTHPLLPAKWEAVALMQDFFENTFWVGKLVYDESAKAFRSSLVDQYGIEADLLVTTDRKLYLLAGGEQPTSCTLLTGASPYTVPARDWLDTGAVCVGQAPILDRQQQWWKSPSGVGANWYWYNSANRLPFRSM